MDELYGYILIGTVFGFSAGISPGPLLTLVITQTLKHGLYDGIKVAIAPIFTDIPIIILSVIVLSRFASIHLFLAVISFAGAAFIFYLAIESIKTGPINIELGKESSHSIRKGILTNALSPHPYIFYLTVAGPLLLKGSKINIILPILFFCFFLLMLVGTKIFIALLIEKSRSFLKSSSYIYTMRFLGIILLLCALLFLKEGFGYLEL